MLIQSNKIIEFLNPINLQQLDSYEDLIKIKNDFPTHTLLPKDFFENMLSIAQSNELSSIGDWVQIGVWKGGGALFLRALMDDLGYKTNLHLYDTFEGWVKEDLHHKKDLGFIEALGDVKEAINSCYLNDVTTLFNQFELNSKVYFNKCDINYIEPLDLPQSISLLHIDVDFFEPIYSSLTKFYPNVNKGGIIIVDDYYLNLVNCKEAVDLFIKKNQLENQIEISQFSSFSLKIKKLH